MAQVLYLYSQALRADSPHARRTFQMLALLKEAGYKADLLTLPSGDTWPKGLAENIYVTSRVPFTRTLKPYGFGVRRAWATVVMAFTAMRLCLQNHYEVVHCSDRAIRIGGLLSWLFGTKFIFEWRSTSGHDLIAWTRWRSKRFLDAVKLVITDVPYTVVQLRESGLYGRIACIQSLPHPSLTPLPPPSIRLGSTPRQFRVTAFSYDDYLADLTHFCDALPHLLAQANLHLTIVGGTPAAAERLRQRLAYRYPQASGAVVIRPKTVGIKDFMDCIREADVVYFPVCNGPVAPHLLLDTMACARAVMATRCPAYEAFLTHQNAALVGADIAQITDCIHQLMKEPLRGHQLARSAEETVRKERSPASAISALRSCYAFILLEPRA